MRAKYKWGQFINDAIRDFSITDRAIPETQMSLFDDPASFLAINHVLEHWGERGGSLLLHDLPSMSNTDLAGSELPPIATTITTHLPNFARMLQATHHIGFVSYQTSRSIDYIIVGLNYSLTDETDYGQIEFNWAYYLPWSLTKISAWERKHDFHLSSQMKTVYMCANGAPWLVCPHFYGLESVYRGSLTEVYKSIWHEIDSPEPYDKLENFITLSENGFGDEYGFFTTQWDPQNEYPIYMWDHEKAKFKLTWQDFGTMLNDLIEPY